MGKSLVQLRHEKNMTQKEVAQALDLAVSTIGMYEAGLRTPRLPMAKRIAAYFAVNLEEISFGTEPHDWGAGCPIRKAWQPKKNL